MQVSYDGNHPVMTSSSLAAASDSRGRFLVLMTIPHKALHGVRILCLKACEQARRARYIDIDTKVFLI